MLSVNAINATPRLAQRSASTQRRTLQFGSDPSAPAPSGGRGNLVKNIVLYLLAGLGLIAAGSEGRRFLDTKAPPGATAKDDKKDDKTATTSTVTVPVGSTTTTTTYVGTPGGYSANTGGYPNTGYLNDPGIQPSGGSVTAFEQGVTSSVLSPYLQDPGHGPTTSQGNYPAK